MHWIIQLGIVLAISSLVFGIILIVEVRRRLKQTDVEVKTRVRLREVQIHPSLRGTAGPPESKQLRWFRSIAYPFASPFILVMFVGMLVWVLLHKPGPIDVEVETRRHKEELDAFVSKSRARMIEARKARVFEQVLLENVRAERAEGKAVRKFALSQFFAGLRSHRMAKQEHEFFKSTSAPHLRTPPR